MKLKIYQINTDRDKRGVRFVGYQTLTKFFHQEKPDATIYDLVYDGEVSASELDDVFLMFNTEEACSSEYAGRSLSTSDVIKVEEDTANTKAGFYYVDSIGFAKICFDVALANPEAAELKGLNALNRLVCKNPKMPIFVIPESGVSKKGGLHTTFSNGAGFSYPVGTLGACRLDKFANFGGKTYFHSNVDALVDKFYVSPNDNSEKAFKQAMQDAKEMAENGFNWQDCIIVMIEPVKEETEENE